VSLVTLVSGGIDSTLMAVLAREVGIPQSPLFIDYGQICKEKEWQTCLGILKRYGLPDPVLMNLGGYGQLISSGLTNPRVRINEDAFLPGRNLLFILAGCAYAYQLRATAVAIGLLTEETHLFPDQTVSFISNAQHLIREAMGYPVRVVAPLMRFTKNDVLELARAKGIAGSYSCHAGVDPPCGICVSCMEIKAAEAKEG